MKKNCYNCVGFEYFDWEGEWHPEQWGCGRLDEKSNTDEEKQNAMLENEEYREKAKKCCILKKESKNKDG